VTRNIQKTARILGFFELFPHFSLFFGVFIMKNGHFRVI